MSDKVFIKGQRVKITNPQTGLVTSGTATGKQARNKYWEIHNHKFGFVFWYPASELEPEPTEPEQPAAAGPDITITVNQEHRYITIESAAQLANDEGLGSVAVMDWELDRVIYRLQLAQETLGAHPSMDGGQADRKKILDDYCALHD